MRDRNFYILLFVMLSTATLNLFSAAAEELCSVPHPLHPPDHAFSGQCPNCGMMRSMWARTWITFEDGTHRQSVCSFHCLADLALKSGADPVNVRIALYLEPTKMVPATEAYVVIGSRAAGTMTRLSKPAFGDRKSAEAFARACEGQVATFQDAFTVAKRDIPVENPMILARRLKKGNIVEPVEPRDRCAVCEMFPARYPKNKCQIVAPDARVIHFCSTQCLFEFLTHPDRYTHYKMNPSMIWVSDFGSGDWISGKTAYYVVGTAVYGPMGFEAVAFDRRSAAVDFVRHNGGRILTFDEISLDSILDR
jgi:nitrous oxide reductase accessory protein NosL